MQAKSVLFAQLLVLCVSCLLLSELALSFPALGQNKYQKTPNANQITDDQLIKAFGMPPQTKVVHLKSGGRQLVPPPGWKPKLTAAQAQEQAQVEETTKHVPKLDKRHTSSSSFYSEGSSYSWHRDYPHALEEFTKYIDTFNAESRSMPDEDKAAHDFHLAMGYQYRAYCYLELRNYRAAIADLNKAIELRPRDSDNFMNRGKAYRLIGRSDLAANDFARAKLLPQDIAHEFPGRQ